MIDSILLSIGVASIFATVILLVMQRALRRRVKKLERELQGLSEVVCEMAESQMAAYHKLSGGLGDIEEKMLDLTIPAQYSAPALDRRHHVLSLARKGLTIDAISRRLNVPRGETELILSLSKEIRVAASQASGKNGEARTYVQN